MALDDKAEVTHRHTTSDIRGGRFPEGMLPSTVIPAIEAAQALAASKSQVIFSALAASGTTYSDGDVWYQRVAGIIIAQWEFTAGAWASRTLDSAVVANLNASKITTGTLSAGTTITAGDPEGSHIELDSAGLRKYAADGTTVQVDLSGGVSTFSGTITGSEIVGGTLRTAVSGNRVEIVPDGTAGGEVQVYTGSVREFAPGGVSALAFDDGTGHQADTIVYGPHLTHVDPGDDTASPPLLLLEMVLDEAIPANDASVIILMADRLNMVLDESTGRFVTTPAEFITHARTRNQRLGSGPQSIATRWRSKDVLVADDSAHLSELLSELSPDIVPSATDPLLVWLVSATAGSQLQYTTDGTTWTVIGGVTFSVTQYTPTSGADTAGSVGDLAADDNYVYTKTATGWKRAAVATW
jgi:hypothetical protein